MKILKKIALVLCVLAVLNVGLSIFSPNHHAAAQTPAPKTTAATIQGCGDNATLDSCLKSNGTDGPDSSVCNANSHTSLEWLYCPITTALGKFTDQINNAVQSLLDFHPNDYLSDSTTTTCGPKSCQVNKAWVIVKNIVSGLVVILMLVMVISQAVGGQLFDAYTVKKMLPRLAIAVILMQFSWVLSKWAISSVNDIAFGIKQIMLAPFGGPQHMTLSGIMNNLDPTFPIATSWAIIGIMFLLLISPFATFILPIFLFVLIAVGSATIVALATLVFRNAIIIMAVIFAPIALLLWATPGQTFQGLWKKYADNVMKTLFLFPLIMAMIYAGRIVAWISAGLSGTSELLSFFVILVAYFYPYILLPKTFKWGGQILATVNQELNNNGVTKWAKGWAYGRVRSEAARRSAKLGKEYDENDNYMRVGRKEFGANHLWQKGGRLNPLAVLTTRGIKDGQGRYTGARTGRKMYQLQGRKLFGVGGGALIDGGLSREGMLRRSEQMKKDVDDSTATLARRAEETGRNRKTKRGEYRIQKNPDGSLGTASMPTSGPYSWMAGIARMQRGLGRGGYRASERAGEELYNDPNFPVFQNDFDVYDPNGDMQTGYNRFRKKHGLKKNYDPKDRREQNMLGRMEQLELLGSRRNADENKEYNELDFWHGIRQAGGPRKYSSGDRAFQGKLLEKTQRDNPEILQTIPGLEDMAIRAVPIPLHDSVQKKATSNSQMKQTMVANNPHANPDSVAKMGDKDVPAGQPGYGGKLKRYNVQSSDDMPIDQGLYDSQDTDNYTWKEQTSAQNIASAHESFIRDLSIKDTDRRKRRLLPLQTVDNMEETTLMWGTPGAKWFKDAFDLKDGQAAGLMAHLLRTPSTRQYFNNWMGGGMPNPSDVPDLIRLKQQHPEAAPIIDESMKTMFGIRRAMGIADNDARPIEDRDWRIMSEAQQRQVYYPEETAEETRRRHDTFMDQKGYKPPQYVSHAIPGEFLPDAPRIPPNPTRQPGANPTAGKPNVFAPHTPGAAIPGAPPAGLSFPDQVNHVLTRFHGGPRALSAAQMQGLVRIHNIGLNGPGRAPGTVASYGNYPREVLLQKRQEARALGLQDDEIQELLGTGVLGADAEGALHSQLQSLVQQQHAAAQAGNKAEVVRLDTEIQGLMPPPAELDQSLAAEFEDVSGIKLQADGAPPASATTEPNVEFKVQRGSSPAKQQPATVVVAAAPAAVAPVLAPAPRPDPTYFNVRAGGEGGTRIPHGNAPVATGRASAPAASAATSGAQPKPEGEGMRHMHEETRANEMRHIMQDSAKAQNEATMKQVNEALRQVRRETSSSQRAIEGNKAIANQHVNSEGIGDRTVQQMANRKVL